MKIIFREYINKFLLLRGFRENIIFNILFVMLFNLFIFSQSKLIFFLGNFININSLIASIVVTITFIINGSNVPNYLNPYVRISFNINKKVAFISHVLIRSMLGYSLFGYMFTIHIFQPMLYSGVLVFILVNAILLTFSIQNIITLALYVLCTLVLIIEIFFKVPIQTIISSSLLSIFIMYWTMKINYNGRKISNNKIFWLPASQISEILVIIMRESKAKFWLISMICTVVLYYTIPYNQQFDLFEWFSQNTGFNLPLDFHFSILLILILITTWVFQYKITFSSLANLKYYKIGTKNLMINKLIITFVVVLVSWSFVYLAQFHIDHENQKKIILISNKMFKLDLTTTLLATFLPAMVFSIISIIPVELGTILKLVIFIIVNNFLQSNEVLNNSIPFSPLIFGISYIVIVYLLWRKENDKKYCKRTDIAL